MGASVCVCCVVLCVYSGLPTDGVIPVQEVLPTVHNIKELKQASKAQQKSGKAVTNNC
jgi:hypothetical protein